jgi:hypothetical protein
MEAPHYKTRPVTRRITVASLKEYLAGEAEKLRTEQSEGMQKRHEWIAAVDRLLAQIKDWLQQADEGRILMIQEASFPISEQGIGTYEITSLTMGVGTREVRVKPVARFVAAPLRPNGTIIPRAFGRVDMTNGFDKSLLLRTEKDPADRWMIIGQDSSRIERFDRNSFESAFQSLLE